MTTPKTFEDLGLSAAVLQALQKKGFENPTPIQREIIPLLLNGRHDIIGQAQTGTGKTAAFGLPLIEMLKKTNKKVQALILTPTRELALQVSEEICSLQGEKKLRVISVYGGQSMRDQLRNLKDGAAIVVGTPGRILDHLERKSLDLSELSHIVLDEADEMLNMGFIDDVKAILDVSNPERRMLLFSATMPKRLMDIADKYMQDRKLVQVKQEQMTSHLTKQLYFEVKSHDKFPALCRLIDLADDFYSIIFCRTKIDVESLAHQLIEQGYSAEGIHGDVDQFNREKTLKKFRNRQINLLVATDVAARGIDVDNVTHVINYALPQNPEVYVHRIGRTGRAGQTGTAITFIIPGEFSKLSFIKRITKTDIERGTLPSIKDIIKKKRQQIRDKIDTAIELKQYGDYKPLVEKLLTKHEPADVIAAILHLTFQSELDENNYPEVSEVTFKRNNDSRPKYRDDRKPRTFDNKRKAPPRRNGGEYKGKKRAD